MGTTIRKDLAPNILVVTWWRVTMGIAGAVVLSVGGFLLAGFLGFTPGSGGRGDTEILVAACVIGTAGAALALATRVRFEIDLGSRCVTRAFGFPFVVSRRRDVLVEPTLTVEGESSSEGTSSVVRLHDANWSRAPLSLAEESSHESAVSIATTIADFLSIEVDDIAGRIRRELEQAIASRNVEALVRAVQAEDERSDETLS